VEETWAPPSGAVIDVIHLHGLDDENVSVAGGVGPKGKALVDYKMGGSALAEAARVYRYDKQPGPVPDDETLGSGAIGSWMADPAQGWVITETAGLTQFDAVASTLWATRFVRVEGLADTWPQSGGPTGASAMQLIWDFDAANHP
jgi:hypothetical protein